MNSSLIDPVILYLYKKSTMIIYYIIMIIVYPLQGNYTFQSGGYKLIQRLLNLSKNPVIKIVFLLSITLVSHYPLTPLVFGSPYSKGLIELTEMLSMHRGIVNKNSFLNLIWKNIDNYSSNLMDPLE